MQDRIPSLGQELGQSLPYTRLSVLKVSSFLGFYPAIAQPAKDLEVKEMLLIEQAECIMSSIRIF